MYHDQELLNSRVYRFDPNGDIASFNPPEISFLFYRHCRYVKAPEYVNGIWALFTPPDYFVSLEGGATDMIDLEISISVPLGCVAVVCGSRNFYPALYSEDVMVTQDDIQPIKIMIKNLLYRQVVIRPHTRIAQLLLFRIDHTRHLEEVEESYQLL